MTPKKTAASLKATSKSKSKRLTLADPLDAVAMSDAAEQLVAAEKRFLVAHGWTEISVDNWEPPTDYLENLGWKRRSHYSQGHAINAQKLSNSYNRIKSEET